MKTIKKSFGFPLLAILSILASCGDDKTLMIEETEEPVSVTPVTQPTKEEEKTEKQESTVTLPKTRLTLTDEQMRNIAPGNDFTFRYFDKAIKTHEFGSEDKGDYVTYDVYNLLLSPLSVQFTLGMLGNYVKCDEALSTMLGFDKADINSVNNYFKTIIGDLTGSDAKGLSIANALMRDSLSIPFKEDFINVIKDNYSIDYLCFEAKPLSELPQGKRPEDDWVREKTSGMIEEAPFPILPEKYALFNTLCFKGEWVDKFDAKNTKEATFYRDGNVLTLNMMHRKGNCLYYKGVNYSSVSLPMNDNAFMMTVLLPDLNSSFADITGQLNSKNWESLRKGMSSHMIDLFLPKFDVSFAHSHLFDLLDENYKKEYSDEINRMYEEDPEHTHIFNKIAQNTVFKVDENGASAAAATQAGMVGSDKPSETIVFNANRPFVYVISDSGSGLVLFIGVFSGKEGK